MTKVKVYFMDICRERRRVAGVAASLRPLIMIDFAYASTFCYAFPRMVGLYC